MVCFRPDGHLTDEALTALVRGDALTELDRLELAEHLAYCDQCLQRYTELLSAGPLLVPEHSCREPLRRRIWRRAVQLGIQRYAGGRGGPGPDAAVGQRGAVRADRPDGAHPHRAGGHRPDGVDRDLAPEMGERPLRLFQPV